MDAAVDRGPLLRIARRSMGFIRSLRLAAWGTGGGSRVGGAVGDAARDAYLAAQVGTTHRAIMEKPRLGRTESFAEVMFAQDRTVGEIVNARIVGVEDGRLIGV